MVVEGLSPGGKMQPDGRRTPIWIVGRAAGASDYLDSLSSGLQAANDVANALKPEQPALRAMDAMCWARGAQGPKDEPRLGGGS
jgi:hypothetical protein